MTRDEVIRLAKEATNKNVLFEFSPQDIRLFERFAELVAAAEREECAKLCEEISDDEYYLGRQYADMLRARGQE